MTGKITPIREEPKEEQLKALRELLEMMHLEEITDRTIKVVLPNLLPKLSPEEIRKEIEKAE